MLATKTKQPFVQVQYRSKIFNTRVLFGANTHPVWNNEVFNLDSHYQGEDLTITVFGKDLMLPIGTAKLTW